VEANAFLSREHRAKLHFPQWAERCENQVLRGAPALTAVAEPLREEMFARGAQPGCVHILPTAVDTDLFHPDPERRNAVRERLQLQDKFVIGYVGGLAGWHGISSLLDMAAILKEHRTDFVFLIVGGEERHVREQETNARTRGLEAHFIFTGSLPYPEVPAHINAMDAAIVPDTLPWTCPTKLFEYQASGVPSVAPDYPGVTQALTDGVEGLLFPKKNVQEAAQRLLTLMENPERCAEIATRAQARVGAEHAWSCNVKTVFGFLEAQRAK
jgi:phosphatidyl-myo-inositol dimannoside synthase